MPETKSHNAHEPQSVHWLAWPFKPLIGKLSIGREVSPDLRAEKALVEPYGRRVNAYLARQLDERGYQQRQRNGKHERHEASVANSDKGGEKCAN